MQQGSVPLFCTSENCESAALQSVEGWAVVESEYWK